MISHASARRALILPAIPAQTAVAAAPAPPREQVACAELVWLAVLAYQSHTSDVVYLKAFMLCLTLIVSLGCGKPEAVHRQIVEPYTLTERVDDKEKELSTITIWTIFGNEKKPLAIMAIDSGKIISIMPTPVQSDAIRPVGNFASIGNGWTPRSDMLFDSRGKVHWLDEPPKDGVPAGEALLDLKIEHDAMPEMIYLVVEQHADLDAFLNLFKKIAGDNRRVGIGWKPAPW